MRKLLFLVAAVAFAQRPWPPPGMKCPERTVAILQIDPANAQKIDQFYDEHLNYIRPFMKSGKVLSAGPTDDGGGFIIFATANWAEAEAIMKKEPFTREGIMKVASHTVWRACEAAP
jgi:uncharacterized protein YciI